MPKEKEGTEEVVGVHDIDEEFGKTEVIAEDAPATTEGKAVTTGTSETPEKEKAEEQVPETVETEEKTWKDLGLGDFEGKSTEEIAKIVLQEQKESDFRNKLYGEQANELGKLRKFKTDQTTADKAADEKAKTKEKVNIIDQLPDDMTEGEIVDFNKIYETNPVKAVLKYGDGTIRQMIAEEFTSRQEEVERFVGKSIDKHKDRLAFDSFLNSTPDAEQYLPAMQTLDGDEYLGKQGRPLKELHGLAKLGQDNDPLYNPIYRLMLKYPNMTLGEAKTFAGQMGGAEEKADEKRGKVQKTIDKIDAVNTSTASSKSQTDKKLVTIDDEFEID